MSSTTASAVIDALREMFSTRGTPDAMYSDNETQFKPREFCNFLISSAIRNVLIMPHNTSGNDKAGRMVKTNKYYLKCM